MKFRQSSWICTNGSKAPSVINGEVEIFCAVCLSNGDLRQLTTKRLKIRASCVSPTHTIKPNQTLTHYDSHEHFCTWVFTPAHLSLLFTTLHFHPLNSECLPTFPWVSPTAPALTDVCPQKSRGTYHLHQEVSQALIVYSFSVSARNCFSSQLKLFEDCHMLLPSFHSIIDWVNICWLANSVICVNMDLKFYNN